MASVDTTRLKALAARVRRQTTSRDILELCDGVLGMGGACPECARRREAKAAAQKRWRMNTRRKRHGNDK